MTNKTWSLFITIAVLMLILLGQATAGTIYKWVDAEGNIHYGEKAPADVQAAVITPDTRLTGSVSPITAEAQKPEANTQNQNALTKATPTKTLSRKERMAKEAELCASARERINQLEPVTGVLIKDADGQMRRMDDDERLKKLQEVKDIEKEFCKK